MSVLVDTSVLFAHLNSRDREHARATAILEEVGNGDHGTPFVTDYVVDELLTLVRSRAPDAAAEREATSLLPLPRSTIPGLTILHTTPVQFHKAFQLFTGDRTRRLSFTDALQLVVVDILSIRVLATFDRALAGRAKHVLA